MAIRHLTDICDIQYGFAFDASSFTTASNEGMPLVRIRDVMNGRTETYFKGSYPKEYIIHKGDYLVGMDGEFNIAPWKSDDALLNQRVCRLKSNQSGVSSKYLFWFLKKELKRIEDETPFVTVKHLSAKRLKQVQLEVPPIAEQEKIIAELDCLSGVIEKKKEQLKELDKLAQSIFYEMFGDPITNEKGWKHIPFEMAIEKVKYTRKLQSKDFLKEGRFPIISQEEDYISGYWNDESDVFYVPSPVVIFGDHTRVLKYVDFDFVLGADGVRILLPIRSISPVFLLHYLKACKIPSLGYSRHYKLLKEMSVAVPHLDYQLLFAKKIEAIEKQKELIKKSIEETQTLFNGRMDYWFN